jgi:hypothetical protein
MRRWALERKKAPHPAEAERGAPPSYVVFLGNEHRHGPAELVHRVRDLLDLIVAVRARVTDLRRQRRATAALDIVGRPVFSFSLLSVPHVAKWSGRAPCPYCGALVV